MKLSLNNAILHRRFKVLLRTEFYSFGIHFFLSSVNPGVTLNDGKVHNVQISLSGNQLSVYLDNPQQPILQCKVNLADIMDKEGKAWIGFTAATGGLYQNHDILSWSFYTK